MDRNVKKTIQEMTLQEKAGMCSGLDFWHLKGIERLGIPSLMVSDGPHGLRKQDVHGDHLGIYDSIEAVCFPAASATAASFDRQLLEEMGEELGKQCQAEDVAVLLGPGVNIKRSPVCGRNFEYFSEDPYVAGELGASFVKGVQSQKVGTSVKHFAANNQEFRRGTISSEVDERTLREIYLPAFETIVKKAKPWTLMCSYNKINGVYASENEKLLTDILRKEWGFEGFVMSDWGAVNKRTDGLEAGLDLEMPSSKGITDKQLVEAVEKGILSEEVLDVAVERILNIIFAYTDSKREVVYNKEKGHELAVKVAEESAILLKNKGDILPLEKNKKIAFIGEFAKKPRYQGGGSSHINAFKVENALSCADGLAKIIYEPGFVTDKDTYNPEWQENAVKAAGEAEVAVIFAGLPEAFESEGYDRSHMQLPDCQNRLIEAVCAVQKNTIIVLHNGSPVEMPWAEKAAAILELYLGGQGVGKATVNILFGLTNPSGKLPESFPLFLAHNPSYLNFPGDGYTVPYQEGIYIGYRYYDKKEMAVRFPFGYGLSYTKFTYSNLRTDKEEMTGKDTLKVLVDITNTGERNGKEVVQLYISDFTKAANRPVRELKGFEKVFLKAGETKTLEFLLDKRSFAWYHTGIADWYCANGEYGIELGSSSRDILLCKKVCIKTSELLPLYVYEDTTFSELLADSRTRKVTEELLYQQGAGAGKMIEEAKEEHIKEMIRNMIENSPLRAVKGWSGMSDRDFEAFLDKFRKLVS